MKQLFGCERAARLYFNRDVGRVLQNDIVLQSLFENCGSHRSNGAICYMCKLHKIEAPILTRETLLHYFKGNETENMKRHIIEFQMD